jgi:hypothetical protein
LRQIAAELPKDKRSRRAIRRLLLYEDWRKIAEPGALQSPVLLLQTSIAL